MAEEGVIIALLQLTTTQHNGKITALESEVII
jgi:hypothetical protein